MSWRPHPRLSETDPSNPKAWATCDRCGFITVQYRMTWDMMWAGNQVINKRFLVCELCVDELQEQLRTIILPADPAPLFNARPEPYAVDETNWLSTQGGDILETEDDILLVTNPANVDMVGSTSGTDSDFSSDFSSDFG